MIMKKRLIHTLLVTIAIAMSANAQPSCCKDQQEGNPYKKYTENLPFAMPEVKAPVIPDYKVNLKDFGGDPTGRALCTDAFAKAIDALVQKGGGHLIVPSGVWLTGPIVLKSNIDLHLKAGAIIQFAADETLYPIIKTSFEGLVAPLCQWCGKHFYYG